MGNIRTQPETTKHTIAQNHPNLHYAVSSMCGWRQFMEDAHIAHYDDNVSVFGVFDGHGGPQCSQFASNHFMGCLTNNVNFLAGDFQKALIETFAQLDAMMLSKGGKTELKEIRDKNALSDNANIYDGETLAGCTANVCLITKNYIFCANAGDSRSIAASRDVTTKKMSAKSLSNDHKPQNDLQKKRIVNAGGTIDVDGRINGNLNLSRSLGDFSYKKNPQLKKNEQLVISEPQIIKIPRKGVHYVLMGCDGIWERKSNEQMVKWIDHKINQEKIGRSAKKIVQGLLDEELSPNPEQELGMDNMTAIMIFL